MLCNWFDEIRYIDMLCCFSKRMSKMFSITENHDFLARLFLNKFDISDLRTILSSFLEKNVFEKME